MYSFCVVQELLCLFFFIVRSLWLLMCFNTGSFLCISWLLLSSYEFIKKKRIPHSCGSCILKIFLSLKKCNKYYFRLWRKVATKIICRQFEKNAAPFHWPADKWNYIYSCNISKVQKTINRLNMNYDRSALLYF